MPAATKRTKSSPRIGDEAVKGKTGFDPNNFLATIGEGRRILSFRRNQGIFAQGDEANAVFFLQAGKVKLSVVAKTGKEATIGILGEGNFVASSMNGFPAFITPMRLL